jgi:2-keto-4-pentenoate hydratase/2-oxohepta-3-ene-1,7-dioic acid hydratase in catechol pathway
MDDLAMHLARHPVYFNKPASSLIGSGQTIEVLPHYGVTHCEPELGVVIGKGGRHISLEAAPDHVFGYTIVNDITSASMRHEDHFHFNFPRPIPGSSGFEIKEEHTSYPARYKGADTFGPTGPWIVTKDEIPNPAGLAVRCWLDDEIIADDNTRNLRFSIAQVIYWISAHATLMPGDIISMGTAFHPDSKMKPLTYGDLNRRGDVLRVDIEGLGSLVNPVKRISRPDPRAEFGG